MSDLQCPATFLLLPSGDDGAAEVTDVAGARLAAVYAGPSDVDRAARVAAAAGLSLTAFPTPAGASVRTVLSDLADLHRGETVAVVLPVGAVAELVALAGGRPQPDDVVQVVVDADGWTVGPWARPRRARSGS